MDDVKAARLVYALLSWLKHKHVWLVLVMDLAYMFNLIALQVLPKWTLVPLALVPIVGNVLFYLAYRMRDFSAPTEEIYFCIAGAIVQLLLSPLQVAMIGIIVGFPVYLRDEKNQLILIRGIAQYDPFDKARRQTPAVMVGLVYGIPIYMVLYILLLFVLVKFGIPALAKVSRIARIVRQMEEKTLS